MTLVLVIMFGVYAARALQSEERARRVPIVVDISNDLFAAIQNFRVERGNVNAALSTTTPADVSSLKDIEESRSQAETALNSALKKLTKVEVSGIEPAIVDVRASRKALAEKRAAQKLSLEAHWRRLSTATPAEIEALYFELRADERCRTLLESYKEEAIRTLRDVESPNLKGLLRRVIGKIFNDAEIKGWCKEFENKNLAANAAGASASEPLATA